MSDKRNVDDNEFIAHIRKDGERQTLRAHLEGVAIRSKQNAKKLDLSLAGEIIGYRETGYRTKSQ